MENKDEKKLWDGVKELLGNNSITLGNHWSFNIFNDPKRLAFVLSRYKFAAKMIRKEKSVLELGCSEGIGVPILTEFSSYYVGVDMDFEAIDVARKNWGSENKVFFCEDFLGKRYGRFDAVVSLDVIEHIEPEAADLFFDTIYNNLSEDGIAIIGTPNITSSPYASEPSKLGHINLYDAKRLKNEMERLFYNTFVFGVNDEVVHTGYYAMCHYLICIGCYKREEKI